MSGGSSDRSPRGAAGMTVQFESGRKMLCKANSKGVALGGSSIDDTASCVKTNFALREPYDRAIGNGCKVELHSKSEVRRGEQANAMREAGNAGDIATAEVGGASQSRGISKHSGRIVSGERRGR